jgi:TetR/AcrR family transcriptional repressor of lmrAB and yxaGH operons
MSSKDDLIRTTIDLMRERGVAGTGISDILEDSGRSRRTVYLNFPGGKAELVDAATRTELVEQVGSMWRKVLVGSRFTSGCPIVAATLGRADSAQAADAAGEAFGSWVALLASRLEEETDDVDTARQQATMIIAAIEGAVIMSIATQSAQPLDDVEKSLLAMYGDR